MAAATKVHGFSVGLVSCACWENHATLKWKKSGFLIILVTSCMFFGVMLPYLTTVIRGSMPALLPLISQAGGEPPSSGIFTLFCLIGMYFAIFAFPLLYVTINQRNKKNYPLIRNLNKVCLLLISLAWTGGILTVCFPVGYTDLPNKFQWVVTVLYEHSTGAALFLGSLCFLQLLFAVVWWYLPDTSKTDMYSKIGFVCVYILLFFIALYPLPAYIIEELGPHPFDLEPMKNLSYSLPIKYSTVYQISSVCEWTVYLLTTVNVATLFKDLQRMSVCIVFRHKSCIEEETEVMKPSISLKSLA